MVIGQMKEPLIQMFHTQDLKTIFIFFTVDQNFCYHQDLKIQVRLTFFLRRQMTQCEPL